MSSIYDDFEDVIRRHKEADAASKNREATDARFDRLEKGLGELTEAVTGLAKRSESPVTPGDDDKGGGNPPDTQPRGAVPPDPKPDNDEDDLPVEVVTPYSVPRIYNGDDEPAQVRYVDPSTGEKKTRKGRRKGHPAAYSVEPYEEPAPTDEPEDT